MICKLINFVAFCSVFTLFSSYITWLIVKSSLHSSGSCDQHGKRPELVAALLEGRLVGVVLDAFEHEPEVLTGGAFLDLEIVVLSPHVGSGTAQANSQGHG
ncbi:hypothetical protein LWI29_036174 [Acer saccharum]|uniref:D-isomer specific 2-hydroxyacid dehydrogenase NAD-binding domain-containing protein n=1 Tax=Acer saccharum TaxID=4024 RepID=A0AA39SSU1_ACESA|nr:hypothetical protein LWI29_036174 [Acer saccharum]KAK1577068.1 hypothetical protein Q3G72_018757 [Acer saccharum]KAK1581396.1 hypothetical protein Q3G72_005654 [Acer saccharum]